VREFVDHRVSGTNDRRPGLDRLIRGVRARKVDVVVVAVFDRFGRSVRDLIESLELVSSWASSSSQRSHKGKRLGRPRIGIDPFRLGASSAGDCPCATERASFGYRRRRSHGWRRAISAGDDESRSVRWP